MNTQNPIQNHDMSPSVGLFLTNTDQIQVTPVTSTLPPCSCERLLTTVVVSRGQTLRDLVQFWTVSRFIV